MFSIRPRYLHLSLALAAGVLAAACAAKTPSAELVAARQAYADATRSSAQRLQPARVLTAKQALDAAESAHRAEPQSTRERALAYVAEREALAAIAHGNVSEAKQKREQAEKRYGELQGELRRDAETQLDQTERALEQRDRAIASKNQVLTAREAELEAEREARLKAEEDAKAAIESLKEIAMVKEEERGMVITLSGEVLFETGKATLRPIARRRLGQVATALKERTDRTITIVGHTDSRGSDDFNLRLSQERAEAVREFMISQGLDTSTVRAEGKGEREPIAENDSAEGRANNRRVEIVLGNDEA